MLHMLKTVAGGTAALALATVGARAQGVTAPRPAVVRANWAEPAAYRGPCPVTLTFHGAIRGTWGTVIYRWARSDGVRTEPEEFAFDTPNSSLEVERVVTMRWTVTVADTGKVWAAVEIVRDMYNQPQPSRAARASVAVTCTTPGPPGNANPCAVDEAVGPVTSQLRACSRWRLERATAELESVAAEVRRQFEADAGAPADERERQALRRRAFEETETAWRAYVAAACAAAYREVFPGTFAEVHRLDCQERLTHERIAELRRTYFPDR